MRGAGKEALGQGLETGLFATVVHPHRVLTITSIAQLLVLGCTWGFGLFLFNPHSTWLSYIFTLLNCLQGLFLYVMLCLLNKKVREEYWKWACMVTGSKYTEFNSSTTGTGTSQTRALRSSESGM